MRINELLLEDSELDEITALGAGQKVGRFGGNVVQGTRDFFTGVKQGYKQARTGQPIPQVQAAPSSKTASAPAASGAAPTSASGPATEQPKDDFDTEYGVPLTPAGVAKWQNFPTADTMKSIQAAKAAGYTFNDQTGVWTPPAASGAAPAAMKAGEIVKDLSNVWTKATADQGSDTTSFQVQNQIRAMAKQAGMAGQTIKERKIGFESKFLGITI